MTEKEVLNKLRKNFDHKYVLTNSFVFSWESDYFGFTKSGYVYEIEVKLSVSDFNADFKKEQKHLCLKHHKQDKLPRIVSEVHDYVACGTYIRNGRERTKYKYVPAGYCKLSYRDNLIPNRFFYAVPRELKNKIKVPEYAGLIIVDRHCYIEKNAPILHKKKLYDVLAKKLLDKFYWLSERYRMRE